MATRSDSAPPSDRRRSQDLLLARRAAAGHAEAWDQLVELYGSRIHALAWQFAGERAEAEDLTQEIFLKLYAHLHRYRGDVPLVGWALRLSRNLCIDHYRRHRLERRSTFVSDAVLEQSRSADDPHARAERRETLALVYRVLERLPSRVATVLVLKDLQGLTYEEIGAFLDVSVGTAKSRVHRARRSFEGELSVVEGQERSAATDAGRPARRGDVG